MSRLPSRRLGPMTTEEVVAMLIGEKLGSGQFRDVYTCPISSELVVKVSREHGNISNVQEWTLWGELRGTKWGRWLCPCHSLSPCGTVLLMYKAEPLAVRPHRVPSFLADLKPENWGTHKGKPVALDYGNNCVVATMLENAGMVRAEWARNSGPTPRRHK